MSDQTSTTNAPDEFIDRVEQALATRGIPFQRIGTGGGCEALVVTDGTREVATTNLECSIAYLRPLTEDEIADAEWGSIEYTMFLANEEVLAHPTLVIYEDESAESLADFLNIAAYLTDHDSDPYEHILRDGRGVASLEA